MGQVSLACSFHAKDKDDRSALGAGRGLPLRTTISSGPAHREGRKKTPPALGHLAEESCGVTGKQAL